MKLLLGAGLLLLASLPAAGQSSVWQVKSDRSTLYLGGTLHLLRASDYPLPVQYEQAYSAAQELYLETDLTAMAEASRQPKFMQQLSYDDGTSLSSVLSDTAYKALADHAAATGIQLAMLDKFRPGMVVMTLQLAEFLRMGFTPMGVDAHFHSRSLRDAKPTAALETVEEQIGFVVAMGQGSESEFILMSLSDLQRSDKLADEAVAAWRAGNVDRLTRLFVSEMQQAAPAIHDSLLRQRNLRWVPKIEQMLDDSDTELVLVGVAHLVGDDGLIELLQARGYEVVQLE